MGLCLYISTADLLGLSNGWIHKSVLQLEMVAFYKQFQQIFNDPEFYFSIILDW